MKKRVGVVFGGRSGEHEISLRSAKTVIEQIDKEKYEVIPIAITRAGSWLNPLESVRLLSGSTRKLFDNLFPGYSGTSTALIGDTRHQGLTSFGGDGPLRTTPLDVVFPVLHGTYGEDGTIQGLLEMADIPYVGCGVLGSACGMDKAVMKSLFADAGLPICKHVTFYRHRWESEPSAILTEIEEKLGYPSFVKPANLGSSVGVSRADDASALKRGIDLAAEYDRKIIVEEGLEMREIECAVLGNDDPKASLPGEYIIHDKSKAFLDYAEKYTGTGNNEFVVPSPIPDDVTEKIREMAVRAFRAVNASGLARVDFFLRTSDNTLLVNEINTMPGLTDASGYPKMWAGSGMEFNKVLDELIRLAFERHADKARNKTSV